MTVNRTDPTVVGNYLSFPYVVKTTNKQETAKKVVAIAVHILLGLATLGLFTAATVAKYFYDKHKVSQGQVSGERQLPNPIHLEENIQEQPLPNPLDQAINDDEISTEDVQETTSNAEFPWKPIAKFCVDAINKDLQKTFTGKGCVRTICVDLDDDNNITAAYLVSDAQLFEKFSGKTQLVRMVIGASDWVSDGPGRLIKKPACYEMYWQEPALSTIPHLKDSREHIESVIKFAINGR